MRKILLVEDDPAISRLYQKAFALQGYEVVVAKDGEEGLIMAINSQPQIILLDVMMPKMNGIELLDALRATPQTQNIPVVVYTNLGSEKDEETILSKGAVKYLVKSDYDPQQVVEIINQVLAGKQ
jgi:CheY-like chemotaxis protein